MEPVTNSPFRTAPRRWWRDGKVMFLLSEVVYAAASTAAGRDGRFEIAVTFRNGETRSFLSPLDSFTALMDQLEMTG